MLVVFLVVPNQAIAEYSLDHDANRSCVADDLVREVNVELNLFNIVSDRDIIVDGTCFWYNIPAHYCYILERYVEAVSYNTLYEMKDGVLVCNDNMNDIN